VVGNPGWEELRPVDIFLGKQGDESSTVSPNTGTFEHGMSRGFWEERQEILPDLVQFGGG
jgi:hypothetical protein